MKTHVPPHRVRLVPVLVLLGAAGTLGCQGGSSAKGPRVRPVPTVVVAPVERRDVDVEVRAPVELKPLAVVDVGSKVLGYLETVRFDRGDRVRRGDLVATVRPSDLPDQLGVARSNLAQATANLELARQTEARARALVSQGYAPEQELERAQAQLAQARAAEAAMQAQIRAVGTRLGETRIVAPMDGVVLSRRLDPGALVGQAGTAAILAVARDDVLRAHVAVNERAAPQVRAGMRAIVELDALPGRPIAATVFRVAPSLDAATRLLDAELRIDNADGQLRIGMYGRARLVLETHRQALVVPASAVRVSEGRASLFVLEGDKVLRRSIRTGVDGGTWLEVVAGLTGNEWIVTAGMDSVASGTTVRARPAETATGSAAALPGSVTPSTGP